MKGSSQSGSFNETTSLEIIDLLVANCKLGSDPVFRLVTMRHARFGCSLCPSHHDRSPHRPTWRIAFGHCRIRPDQTPASDRESLPPPCAQSPRMGPTDRRLMLAVDPASPSLAISDRIQAIDPVEFPSRSGSAQIQIPVFAKTPSETRTKRP